jgi:acetoin utilization protein AcuC
MRKAAFIHSPQLEKYHYPPDCPFNITRAGKTRKILDSMGLLTGENRGEVAPQPADRIVLKKFHSARYLHALQAAAKGKFDAEAFDMGIGTADCPIFKDMYDYSVWACGATLTGAKLILTGQADIAFNPSGGLHHAGPERASGFCFINDMALACIVLTEAGKRVLYLDVDVHHGDGVQNVFYSRSDVMTISFHESGRTLFPGTGFENEIGEGEGKGYSVNVPLPVGTYDRIYMKAFTAVAVPLIKAYNPDVIVFELGADALAGDPLAHLYLTNNTYAEIIEYLLSFNKPVLAAGGGGYHIGNTVRAWALAWSIFCGADSAQNINAGAGGVMLETTDWQGGLRDRTLVVSAQQRQMVTPQVEATIETIKANIFPYHGL